MENVDAQIAQQSCFMNLEPHIITAAESFSSEHVNKMIFLFCNLMSEKDYWYLVELSNDQLSNGGKIVYLIKYVLGSLNLPEDLCLNIWAELLFLSKLYKHLKTLKSCKHAMKAFSLRGAKLFTSEFLRLLVSLSDELTDDDIHYIWTNSLDGKGSVPKQPEILFHQMMSQQNDQDKLLKELSLHFSVMGKTELQHKIELYLRKKETGGKKTKESPPREEYDLNPVRSDKTCGVALIFNNKTFEKTPHPSVQRRPLTKLSTRNGTEKDTEKLKQLWESFGVECHVYNDLCSYDFKNCLEGWLKKNLSNKKIFIICILTHGEEGVVYLSDRIPFRIRDVEQYLGSSQKLAGKPKLLFIQACQGHDVQAKDSRGSIARRVELDGPDDNLQSGPQVPQYSDMLIGLATVPGFMSIRNIKEGTHFIQTLVSVLEASGTEEDFSVLITEINYKVHKMWANADYNGSKLCLVQMPTFHNQLTKQLRFQRVCD